MLKMLAANSLACCGAPPAHPSSLFFIFPQRVFVNLRVSLPRHPLVHVLARPDVLPSGRWLSRIHKSLWKGHPPPPCWPRSRSAVASSGAG